MLYLSGIILAFFLSLVLITKRNKTAAEYILVAWLSITGFHLLTFYLFFTKQYIDYPSLIVLGFSLPLAQGPFLYLYTRQQTSSMPFDKIQLLHFLPVILFSLLFAEFYFFPFEEKVEVFKQSGRGFETQLLINLYAVFASGIVYVTISLIRLLKYKKSIVNQFSNTEKINFNWLLYLIIWMAVIWIVVLFVQEGAVVFSAVALFVIWLGYFGIRQVHVFGPSISSMHVESASSQIKSNEEKIIEGDSFKLDETSSGVKYQKSSLSEQEADLIHERLKNILVEQKPFTNPDLTLNDLATTLNVHPNYLSQVINSKKKKNFYELINEKRVEEFIKLISKSSTRQYTLLGIAFDCGFNSKASFNRNFKKHTGLTPSEYLKKQIVN
jgi:AraC-like DNA-binding protein